MPKSSKATKPASKSNKPTKAKPQTERQRVTILGHSATSVLKYMGANGWDREAAVKALEKLSSGGEVSPATISTGLSDGRNPKYATSAAKLSAAEAKQLKAAAK